MTAITSGWTDTEVSVRLRRGANGAVRVDGTLCTAPLWFRWDGATLWMVGSGASPAGEDDIRVRIEVGPDVDVAVRSVAATVVYAARGAGTRWRTEITVAEGASLRWQPEPVILTERARHDVTTTIHAAATAEVTLDDILVLGRDDETHGTLRSTLDVDIDDVPTLLTAIDTSLPGWAGPAGVDGAGVVANRLRLGPVADASEPQPEGRVAVLHAAVGCRLAVATAVNVSDARCLLEAVLPA